MKYPAVRILLTILVLLVTGCHHNADLSIAPPKPPDPGPEFKCSHDTIYFRNSVLPVIISGCAKTGCHDEATHKASITLENYSQIVSHVIPFDPQGSKLYKVLFSNSGERMPPGTPLVIDQKSIIYWWIAQGAFNNKCDSAGCDSTNVTYAASIAPICAAWCTGCHGGSNPANGLSLETYDEVAACANSGRLMGAIRHETGFSWMPKGGEMLSPCDINLFQKWINIGKP